MKGSSPSLLLLSNARCSWVRTPQLFLRCLLLSTLASAQVTISGTFKSVPPGSEVAITCYNNPIERDELAVANAKLDEHGSFSVTFPWGKPGEAQLQVVDQYT